MPLSTSARNVAVAALAAQATHLSLHSDVPDQTGSNEVSGGLPLYARLPTTWLFPSDGTMAIAAPVVFDVPAGAVAFVGLWSALVAGSFLGYAPVNGGGLRGAAFCRAATDDFLSQAHGLVVGDRVTLQALPGQSVPAGALPGVLYYVVSTTSADLFQLAVSPFDAPLALTADGPVSWQRSAVDVFSAQGTVTVSTLSIVVGA